MCVCCHVAFLHGEGGDITFHPYILGREGPPLLFICTSVWRINWAHGCLCRGVGGTYSQRRAGLITPWLGNVEGLV